MITSPQSEFHRDLHRVLKPLRKGSLKVHIPHEQDLHRRKPGSQFHATPELFIQTGGATDFVCPGDAFRVNTGEVCVMPRGVPHAETPQDLDTPYGVLVCMYDRNGFFLHRGRTDPAHRIQGYGTIHLRGPREFFSYLDDVAKNGYSSSKYRKTYIRSLLEAFLLTILMELDRPLEPSPTTGSPLILETEKYVRTHIGSEKLTVADMALALGRTADHLSRQFHRERGISLSTWIAKERIALAKDMLTDLRYNIAEIGWACGFSEASYFIRVFRRHTGLTPKSYRQGVKQPKE